MKSPYREQGFVEKEKAVVKYKEYIFVFLAAVCLAMTGISGQYLSRNLPEGHSSCSGFFAALAFICLFIYFVLKAIIASKNNSD